MTELIKSLIQFQSEVGSIAKTKDNLFFDSKYVDFTYLLEKIRPILVKFGLFILQTTRVVDDKNILNTKLIHESGESIESEIILLTAKSEPQALASSLTYMRRYSYMNILGLTASDDDGNYATHGSYKPQKQSVPSNGNGKQKELGVCPVCRKPKLMADRYAEGVKYCLGCGKKFDSNMKEIVKVSQTNEQQTFDHDGFPEHNPDPTEKYPF